MTWRIFIDTGGTFTDCIGQAPDGNWHRIKVLSTSRLRGRILATTGRREARIEVSWGELPPIFAGYALRMLGADQPWWPIEALDPETGKLSLGPEAPAELPCGDFELTAHEEAPLLAARLLTGTPLAADLPPLEMRLGTTRGTNALLERKGARVVLLINEGLTDLLRIGTQARPDIFALDIQRPAPLYVAALPLEARLNAQGEELFSLRPEALEDLTRQLRDLQPEAIAIAGLHAYRNPVHEQALRDHLRAAGFAYLSCSHELAPAIKLLPRAQTAVVDAYLAPIMDQYLKAVGEKLPPHSLKVMSSAGGLIDARFFRAKDSLLSGPAGGVVGAAQSAREAGFERVLSLDMGGTSTDVARYDGSYSYRYETAVGDATLLSPALAIETVAAGGGSLCGFDGQKLTVGPESAGAQPGPACYGAGGPLSLTDVNLLTGRLDPGQMGIPLSREAAETALQQITESSGLDRETLLSGWLRIANEKMAAAIRQISVREGYDPHDYVLLAFGGAGGQHACAVADLLGMQQVMVPADAGILSAVGMGKAVIERFASRQVLEPWEQVAERLPALMEEMEKEALEALAPELPAGKTGQISSRSLHLRLQGQAHTLELSYRAGMEVPVAFRHAYESRYGHWLVGRALELESMKVIAALAPEAEARREERPASYVPEPAYCQGGWPVFHWDKLAAGAEVSGPALLLSPHSTVVVEKGWSLQLDGRKHATLHATAAGEAGEKTASTAQAVELELFTNRFRQVADEMGALLERSSFSVNVKERLDFSCALLDAGGELVVNAPHIPVHLGSLGVCVRRVTEELPLAEGDIAITNHPGFGGSHLPDVTLISPVFFAGEKVGYVVNRAHHAEIGGSRPGSMPPDAKTLVEEGVVIPPMYLQRGGEWRWETLKAQLTGPPFPTRSLEENLADLSGAIASLQAGQQGLQALCKTYGLDTVRRNLQGIKAYAAERLRAALGQLPAATYVAKELLDDGTPLVVKLSVSPAGLKVDFTGSGPQHPANLNANPAIVYSAVLYVLRLLVAEPIPLNEGLLAPVELVLPPGILNPHFPEDPARCPAVVGGNVETSQRLVDTLLKALGLASCSQGTMNNLLFGNDAFGYYETIGGGAGAGPGFAGASGVHQHMTNTRMTDPEVMEFRYPVRVERFALRRGSGGAGRWPGGEGIERVLHFLAPVSLTLLGEHRVVAPYGLEGGHPGAKGEQWILRQDGRQEKLGGKAGVELAAGEKIFLLSPGGGGYGR